MLNFVNGNVLTFKTKKTKVIPHCCNNIGLFGAGVALQIGSFWPSVKKQYEEWYNDCWFTDELNDCPFQLGQTQFLKAEEGVFVGNMIGQSGTGFQKLGGKSIRPVRYDSLRECMLRVVDFCNENDCVVVAPYFSTELAGGSDKELIDLINEVWSELDVTLVKFEKGK